MAVHKDSRFCNAHNNLGLIYKNQGDYSAAAGCFEKALSIKKDSALYNTNFSILLLDMGETDKAIEYALAALRYKQNMYEAMDTLAIAYSIKGDREKAEEYYQKSVLVGESDSEALRKLMNNAAPSSSI